MWLRWSELPWSTSMEIVRWWAMISCSRKRLREKISIEHFMEKSFAECNIHTIVNRIQRMIHFNVRNQHFANYHNVYIWSDWRPLSESARFSKLKKIFCIRCIRLTTVSSFSVATGRSESSCHCNGLSLHVWERYHHQHDLL
jgi:hypothetical protein